jgi:MFS family permease
MGFILNRWRSFGPICLVLCLLSVLGYGTLNWYPTFLIRTYGMSVGDVGVSFGLIYLVFGILGALGGALTSEILLRRGYQDANLRTIMLVSAALLLPAALGPLMPNAGLALALAAPTVFLLNAFFGASIAALQLVTPNQMRAVNSALFLFTNNLVGLTLGSSLVAYLTDFVFKNDMAVRYSLVIVPLIVCPLATIVAWWGLKPYRIALKEAASWQ